MKNKTICWQVDFMSINDSYLKLFVNAEFEEEAIKEAEELYLFKELVNVIKLEELNNYVHTQWS